MRWFSYLNKREVLQQEYSQSPILSSPHFRWVVNMYTPLFSSLCCGPRTQGIPQYHRVWGVPDQGGGCLHLILLLPAPPHHVP